jgi:hypothetical protein
LKNNNINNDFSENDYQDILEYHPNWILRWGVTIIAILILLLIFASMYIDEPELIKSKYVLTLKHKLTKNSEIYNKDSNECICKLFLEIQEKNKLQLGKKVNLEFRLEKTGKIYSVEGIVDSIEFNPDREKYELAVYFISGIDYDIESEIIKNGILIGEVNILIDKKSLFDRIFGKYKEIRKL